MSESRSSLTRFAWLSIAAALATIALKSGAYLLTGSVGLLSDAVESVVNLAGALMALGMLTVAARPADDDHMYGHSKAEYFSSVVEGILILIAAAGIGYTAIERFFNPQPIEQAGIGLAVSVIASLINLGASRVLLNAGRKYKSISLEADAHHLMTDVWTSVGVIGGVAAAAATGWVRLDPIVALIVAANIVWTGIQLVRRSVDGFMDKALTEEEHAKIEVVMKAYRDKGVEFHALRTRQSAARSFITLHMLVPGAWTVHDAHHVAEDFEHDVRTELGEVSVTTHLEPIDDEISMEDVHDR